MAGILITGGAGFIGSNLAEGLCKEHSITILDNLSTGRAENIPKSSRVRFQKGDVCSHKDVRAALEGVDCVLHLAAIASVPYSMKDPVKTDLVNVGGTVNLLHESARAEVDRFIFASSSSVYGNEPGFPKTEDSKLSPLSPYAESKLGAEGYCSVFAKSCGLSTVSLRYFNVFGPRQDPASEYSAVIPKFASLMKKGKAPTVFGNGEQTRDFTYIRDVARANELVFESKGGSGEAYNIATGSGTSLNELVKALNRILGKRIKPVYKKARVGDVKLSLADISKAKRTFGYEPKWSFEDGLKETVKQL